MEQIEKSQPAIAKHTPGPWKQATRGPNGCPIVGNGHGLMVAMIAHSANEHDQAAEAEANARLIAAAPELLEALETLVSACELPGDHCEIEQALPAAIAAISKAIGA